MIRLALLLICLAASAFATQDGYPALYDVSGVDTGDVLNIRAAPDANAEIIGSLSASAKSVEVVRPNERETWGLVNTGETPGWVSLAFMTRHPGQWLGQFPAIRQCLGTEPFWSLQVEDAALDLSMPEAPSSDGLISERFASLSRRDRFVYRGTLRGEDVQEFDVTLMIRLGACSDGMSDRSYGVEADMLISSDGSAGNQQMSGLYTGCCSLSPPPAR